MELKKGTILIELLAKDKDVILYRKELNIITGSVTATILLQQIIFRYVSNQNKAFYKFIEPCKHEKYKDGDSWCEELGFTRKEFLTAIKKLEDAGLVSKKTNMQRLTFYTVNLGDLDKALKGIYVNAKRGFIKMPKGDLDYIDTENTTENTTDINLGASAPEQQKKFSAKKFLIENEVSEKTAQEFIDLKNKKRKTITDRSLKIIFNQAIEAQLSNERVFQIIVLRGWESFKAAWNWQETNAELEQLDNPTPKQQHIPQNFTEDKGDW